jgi:hypothetical protein
MAEDLHAIETGNRDVVPVESEVGEDVPLLECEVFLCPRLLDLRERLVTKRTARFGVKGDSAHCSYQTCTESALKISSSSAA